MQSSNLSSLVFDRYFFELLEQEKISFDRVISDKNIDLDGVNFALLDQPFPLLIQQKGIQKSDHILVLLDQLNVDLLLMDLIEFDQVSLLISRSGLASLGYKTTPELGNLISLQKSGFKLLFPFDERQFFTELSKQGRCAFYLTNQEIADTIYTSGEDEELAFIDKALAEQPLAISLINNPEAETHIVMQGNYFEEGVKLSSYLLEQEHAYHQVMIGSLEVLSSDFLRSILKKSKKLIIILDQKASQGLKYMISEMIGVDQGRIILICPEYDQVKSYFPEYQFEEAGFDAQSLAERIKKLV